MSTDYIPKADALFVGWAVNFKTVAVAEAATLGLTIADTTELTASVEALQAKMLLATEPVTRGQKTIMEKNEARTATTALVRTLVRRIQAAPGVTDDLRFDLGINIPKPRTRREAPTEKPKADLVAREGTSVYVRFHDGSGTKRGKPDDVTDLLVFSYVGPTPPETAAEWTAVEVTGRTLVRFDFPTTLPAGTSVWMTASYRNAAGTGPGADPLGTVLAGGGVELPMAA
jgi:hypothetical protein